MTNILVTGGNGQLANSIKDLEFNHSDLNFIYTDFLELDICDLNQVKKFFKRQSKTIHYCINCAAYTAVDKAETETKNAFKINVEGAKNLALACLEHNVNLIHISTDFVFDGKSDKPYVETDKANPVSVYGETKLKGELEIKKILENFFIIRTSWLYSEHGNNFMKTMLRLAKDKDVLNIVGDQIGTPTYAKDLAEVIYEIIISKNTEFGVYHYSNEGVASWYDFAKEIFEIKQIRIKVNAINTEDYPTPAKRPKFSVLDKSKVKALLSFEIPHWRDSLKKAILNY
ncbi:dTDP-4-dehydrorhamnose reductase [Jejuia pallidilutea]|uniref:dTDP-4-dehydrorhamnose reductase n=1 Tax=Jejuia pallidilutea TaxID=504487 RepID=A0A362X2D3_9FLAO|nr:dTDP-4-dehydrorhamnose reductase [Jejuia pallidilutea]PQV49645.1 dTDP-4-dehydrorhamnose reductase [Jejuia pallidilutea]